MSSDLSSCASCGELLQWALVAHPLHFQRSDIGLGKCRYEHVSYCPACNQPRPSFHGTVEYYPETFEQYAARITARWPR